MEWRRGLMFETLVKWMLHNTEAVSVFIRKSLFLSLCQPAANADLCLCQIIISLLFWAGSISARGFDNAEQNIFISSRRQKLGCPAN